MKERRAELLGCDCHSVCAHTCPVNWAVVKSGSIALVRKLCCFCYFRGEKKWVVSRMRQGRKGGGFESKSFLEKRADTEPLSVSLSSFRACQHLPWSPLFSDTLLCLFLFLVWFFLFSSASSPSSLSFPTSLSHLPPLPCPLLPLLPHPSLSLLFLYYLLSLPKLFFT